MLETDYFLLLFRSSFYAWPGEVKIPLKVFDVVDLASIECPPATLNGFYCLDWS